MCHFPSWIRDGNHVWFLTDKEARQFPHINDAIGHTAIRELFGVKSGVPGEGFPCPPEVAAAINAGKMQRMMEAGGYKRLEVAADGNLAFSERMYGTLEYWRHSKRHREGAPAIVRPDGTVEYWQYGALHREGEPAIVRSDGTLEYWQNGLLHREGAPAIEYPDGTIEYWLNNKRHREDGPAIIRPDGTQEYWENDVHQRTVKTQES